MLLEASCSNNDMKQIQRTRVRGKIYKPIATQKATERAREMFFCVTVMLSVMLWSDCLPNADHEFVTQSSSLSLGACALVAGSQGRVLKNPMSVRAVSMYVYSSTHAFCMYAIIHFLQSVLNQFMYSFISSISSESVHVFTHSFAPSLIGRDLFAQHPVQGMTELLNTSLIPVVKLCLHYGIGLAFHKTVIIGGKPRKTWSQAVRHRC